MLASNPPLVSPISGVALLRDIAAGTISRAEAVAGLADAHAGREAELGAFVAADYAHATDHAGDGPLKGLPVGVKDIMDTAGFATEQGSPIYAGNRSRGDAAVVALTRRAGGAVVGKTVTTEFAFLNPSATRNPWNTQHTPGGSSSGSVAAVAAGMLPFAFGTQTGGSIVRPAAYCGIAGFKPSYGLLPIQGVKPFSLSLDTVGVFGAGVADCAFFASLLADRPLDVPEVGAAPRIGSCRTAQWDSAEPQMQAAIMTAADAARDGGATVTDCDLPALFARAFDAHRVVQNFEAARALAWEYDTCRDQLSELLAGTLAEGADMTSEAYDGARRVAKAARLGLMDVFKQVDVLLTPSAEGPAPRGFASTGNPTFNKLWTLMGVPCVNVPGLMSDTSLPLGVQIVGPAMGDQRTLAAAHWLQRQLAS